MALPASGLFGYSVTTCLKAEEARRAGRFLGVYRYSSSPHTTLIKIVELFGAYRAEVSDPGDGTLLLTMSGSKWRFVEVEPLYFHQVDGSLAMVFREDDRGRITRMYTDFMPWYGTVKLDWYETSGFNMALALGCVLVFLSMIPAAAIRAIRNRRLSGDRKPAPRGARAAYWIILGICLLNLLFLVGSALWGNPPTELGSVSMNARIVLTENGKPADVPFDGYAEKPTPSGPINLGVYEPKDGKFMLRAEVVGTNPASTRAKYFFGLDAVVLDTP